MTMTIGRMSPHCSSIVGNAKSMPLASGSALLAAGTRIAGPLPRTAAPRRPRPSPRAVAPRRQCLGSVCGPPPSSYRDGRVGWAILRDDDDDDHLTKTMAEPATLSTGTAATPWPSTVDGRPPNVPCPPYRPFWSPFRVAHCQGPSQDYLVGLFFLVRATVEVGRPYKARGERRSAIARVDRASACGGQAGG